jgi:hypothetical protein
MRCLGAQGTHTPGGLDYRPADGRQLSRLRKYQFFCYE